MSIKVAVRVRPFNSNENSKKLVIQMENNITKIIDPTTNEAKEFAFDYSFWSHDGF